jgi:hypothetical protein
LKSIPKKTIHDRYLPFLLNTRKLILDKKIIFKADSEMRIKYFVVPYI